MVVNVRREFVTTASEVRSQWHSPSEILSVLMIIGGDIVQRALGQLSGGTITPVCFSFGWVAYSFTTMVNVLGSGRLMPEPDVACKIINMNTGFARDNRSWILGRLLRDQEPVLSDEALCVLVYQPGDAHLQTKVIQPKSMIAGFLVIVLQLVIAAIPVIKHQSWGIILITSAGTLLALVTGSLPQWKAEKYACRIETSKNIAITAGNGSRLVLIVLGNGKGLDLEDLAGGESPGSARAWERFGLFKRQSPGSERNDQRPTLEPIIWMGAPLDFWFTRLMCLFFTLFWIALLITVSGLRQNSWFLVLVGALGMGQNAFAAGLSRSPANCGINLQLVERISGRKVMDVLMDLETGYPNLGKNLLKEFEPGELRQAELKWWAGDRGEYDNTRIEESHKRGFPRSFEEKKATFGS